MKPAIKTVQNPLLAILAYTIVEGIFTKDENNDRVREIETDLQRKSEPNQLRVCGTERSTTEASTISRRQYADTD
jgi:hypothetical protein